MIKEKKTREVRVFVILVILSFLFMGLDKVGWLDFIKRPLGGISNPVKEKIHIFSLKYQKANHKSQTEEDINYLKNKIEELERENANLKVENENLKQENEASKRLLGAPLPASWHFIPAKVIGVKDGILSINQGSDSGLIEGQVVVFENVLVGKIINVTPRAGKIMLPIHKDMQIKAKVAKTGDEGLVKLDSSKALVLKNVLQEAELEEGQIVVTSGEEEKYPEGLLIGKIEKIEKEETDIYQQAILKLLVDYNALSNVFVVE